MNDAKTWFDKFNQDAKEKNIQLKTELINSQRPVNYLTVRIRRAREYRFNCSRNKRKVRL